uniref:Uncharacterized protein n=1 Tax=uncultured bacterium contig00034 TaxID=1181523 RepID=A0A806JZG2_9BACT|nr:hypothetical protein [uncultured bacterium contig00034]
MYIHTFNLSTPQAPPAPPPHYKKGNLRMPINRVVVRRSGLFSTVEQS